MTVSIIAGAAIETVAVMANMQTPTVHAETGKTASAMLDAAATANAMSRRWVDGIRARNRFANGTAMRAGSALARAAAAHPPV